MEEQNSKRHHQFVKFINNMNEKQEKQQETLQRIAYGRNEIMNHRMNESPNYSVGSNHSIVSHHAQRQQPNYSHYPILQRFNIAFLLTIVLR